VRVRPFLDSWTAEPEQASGRFGWHYCLVSRSDALAQRPPHAIGLRAPVKF